MSKFGIIGNPPAESDKLSGRFSISDQVNLNRDGDWGNKFEAEYLVIGGGGGGSAGTGGGGGAGGYRTGTVALKTGIEYTITVGGGGSGGNGTQSGTTGANGKFSRIAETTSGTTIINAS